MHTTAFRNQIITGATQQPRSTMRWFDRGNVCPPQRNPTRGDADGAFGVRRPAVGLAGVLFFQGPGRRRVLESPSPPFPGEGLVIACGKGFRMRFGKKGIGAVASITAAAALLTCLVPVALADNGGGGSGEGGGGDHAVLLRPPTCIGSTRIHGRPRWMA